MSLANESHLLYYETSREIIGAFYETHRELGYGFVEAVYRNGLVVLLKRAGVDVALEVSFNVDFHGGCIGRYRADVIVASKIILEVKTGLSIAAVDEAQLRNYLRVSKLAVGLLLNFGPRAQFRRLIWTPKGTIVTTA